MGLKDLGVDFEIRCFSVLQLHQFSEIYNWKKDKNAEKKIKEFLKYIILTLCLKIK